MISRRLQKLAWIIRHPTMLRALILGAAAGVEHWNALKGLDCSFIVDVGAHRGQFALIARKLFPNASIHSFEPLAEPSRIYQKVFKRDSRVSLIPLAIGREEAAMTIHITRDDDSSSLLPVTERLAGIFSRATQTETRAVKVTSLKHALKTVRIPTNSLLKIDVQGFELSVLQGCDDLLGQFSHLYIECSFLELYQGQALAHQIIHWLWDRGFELIGIYNLYYDKAGKAIQGDFLFSHAR